MRNLLLLYTILFATILKAQEPVTWVTGFEKVSNTEYVLSFEASIIENWHLYALDLPEDGPVPTEFVFKNEGEAYELVGAITASESITEFDPIFEMELSYFDKKASFRQRIRLLKPETSQITGEINYQACDDKVCIFREESFDFNLSSDVVKPIAEKTIDAASKLKSEKLKINFKDKSLLDQNANKGAGSGYFNLFLLGFLGGIIALLTPCVFPMIPLTVSFFLKHSGSKKQGVIRAVLYGFFILIIYLILSLPFHFLDAVDPQILNNIATNIVLNVVFFLVFVFFAFSFFGYYELTLPSGWGNRSDTAASGGGVLGIFFMALTLAIVSFSCTGPILGSLLASSLSSDAGAMQLTVGMGGFGAALALPFALFAVFPNALQSIPKSGGWMTKIKVILGFLELALALKFLSNADLVGHWGLLKREIFIGIWLIISLLLFLYLMGWLRFPHDVKGEKIKPIQRILAVLALIFVVYLGSGLGKDQKGQLSLLSGFPPPVFYSIYELESDCPLALNCFKDFEAGQLYALKTNKPILLDFTGWACVNCRKMEENVWSQGEVYRMLKDEFIIISLYIDDRTELPETDQFDFQYPNGRIKTINTIGEKWATFQSLNFESASQPFYVLMSPDNVLLNQPIQYTDKVTYENWLKQGLQKFKTLK